MAVKNVGVLGLGLIGGSMARAFYINTTCNVYGYDLSADVVDQAVYEGAILDRLEGHYDSLDMLVVALYPADVVDIILQTAPLLKKGCIVIDCTGIKGAVCSALSEKLAGMGLRFIGGHPMAGKEVAGYDNSEASLFDGASMILCRDEFTDNDALEEAKEIFRRIGFGRVVVTTSVEHDKVIAYTSQLAHVVSSAYIKSPTLDKRYGFSAGSFKDMTRVAKLNEEMWADLFLANDEALVCEIDELVRHLNDFSAAIKDRDRDRLVALLKEGRIRKEEDTKKEDDSKR